MEETGDPFTGKKKEELKKFLELNQPLSPKPVE